MVQQVAQPEGEGRQVHEVNTRDAVPEHGALQVVPPQPAPIDRRPMTACV